MPQHDYNIEYLEDEQESKLENWDVKKEHLGRPFDYYFAPKQHYCQYVTFISHKTDVTKTYDQIIEERFNELAEKWKLETSAYSTTIHKITNPNYRLIIRMGKVVVPFILKDLNNYSLWFTALRELTGANPVPAEDKGNTERMRQAWIAWGKRNGLI